MNKTANANTSYQVVFDYSWATLVSSSPNLKVNLTVEQVIDTHLLTRILLPKIPLTVYSMTAFYSADENWSAKPLLHNMLPYYRHSLQVRALSNSHDMKPKIFFSAISTIRLLEYCLAAWFCLTETRSACGQHMAGFGLDCSIPFTNNFF